MQLNGLAFNQDRLKSLNTQAVQRRSPVQHDRVFFDDLFQNVPDHRSTRLNFFFCCLDGGGDTAHFELRKNEGLKKFQRHQFRQTALVQFQGWTNRNDRTT